MLRMLVVAAVLDGRLTRKERHLLRDAFAAAGMALDLGAVQALRRPSFAETRCRRDGGGGGA